MQGNAFADGGFEGSSALGGLVGWNIGSIDFSFATMNITAYTTTQIGGLVGLNWQTGTTTGTGAITNSWAGGSITAGNKSTLLFQAGDVGGVVGEADGGPISNVYSTTNITVTADYYLGPGTVGGLTNNEGNAYFQDVGGLIGTFGYSSYTNVGTTLTNAYYNGTMKVIGAVDGIGGAIGGGFGGGGITNVTTGGTIIGTTGPVTNLKPEEPSQLTPDPVTCNGCSTTMTVYQDGALIAGTPPTSPSNPSGGTTPSNPSGGTTPSNPSDGTTPSNPSDGTTTSSSPPSGGTTAPSSPSDGTTATSPSNPSEGNPSETTAFQLQEPATAQTAQQQGGTVQQPAALGQSAVQQAGSIGSSIVGNVANIDMMRGVDHSRRAPPAGSRSIPRRRLSTRACPSRLSRS